MIPLEKLRGLERCYTHKNCPDGTASALILRDALPDLQIHFVAYGSQEHKSIEPLPNTIFCDFSPWLPKLEDPRGVVDMEDGRTAAITDKGVLALREELIKKWNEAGVVVLDHHSKDIVEPYEFGVFGENDKLECGAMLAYREVWVPFRGIGHPSRIWVETFARLAAIRDTWQSKHEDWEDACEQASELMFWKFEQLNMEMTPVSISLGGRLLQRQIELAHTCIKEAFSFTSERGTRVLMFQGVSATSDAAEQLGDEADLVVGFHYRNEGDTLKLQFSTRSHTGYDCQALARANGGNGHKAAAGFTIEAHVGNAVTGMNPYAVFQWLLKEYEAKL